MEVGNPYAKIIAGQREAEVFFYVCPTGQKRPDHMDSAGLCVIWYTLTATGEKQETFINLQDAFFGIECPGLAFY